jgi:exodeoxyribonuclease VII small subunit
MAKPLASVQDLNYEKALAELEKLLSSLESESTDLEGMMAMFERGKELISRCQELLDKAELKVRQLTANGEIVDLEEQE